jgi:hypothetical protein
MTRILQRWLDGTGAFPDWPRLHAQINTRYPAARGVPGLRMFMDPAPPDALFKFCQVLAGACLST